MLTITFKDGQKTYEKRPITVLFKTIANIVDDLNTTDVPLLDIVMNDFDSILHETIATITMPDHVYNGNLQLGRYLGSYIVEQNVCYANICLITSIVGDLYVLRYAREIGCPWDEDTCSHAAANGHLDCLQYAHDNGCPWDKFTCMWSARSGHLNCLKYAHENGCPWDNDIGNTAAKNGHADCLEYAHECGCSLDEFLCDAAAKCGYLDCLRYAHEHGCPLSKITCNIAAVNGHVDCLKYAHENGCPLHPSIWYGMGRRKAPHPLRGGFVFGTNPLYNVMLSTACPDGAIDCLKYVHENGCPIADNPESRKYHAYRLKCAAYIQSISQTSFD